MKLPYEYQVLNMAKFTGSEFKFVRAPSEVNIDTTTIIMDRGGQAEFFKDTNKWAHCRHLQLEIDLDDLVVRQLQIMPNLEYLSLEVMKPGDKLDLSNSHKLLFFKLSLLSTGCNFDDISLPVSTIQACIKITKKRNSIGDIMAIGAPNLQRLCLYGRNHTRTVLESLDPVKHWQKLRFLDLYNIDVSIKDLSVLNGLPNLEILTIDPKLRWIKHAYEMLDHPKFELV